MMADVGHHALAVSLRAVEMGTTRCRAPFDRLLWFALI
jgi:hypothetical protein